MQRLTVQHVTTYRYAQPVRFGAHRLMFRPRDSHLLEKPGAGIYEPKASSGASSSLC